MQADDSLELNFEPFEDLYRKNTRLFGPSVPGPNLITEKSNNISVNQISNIATEKQVIDFCASCLDKASLVVARRIFASLNPRVSLEIEILQYRARFSRDELYKLYESWEVLTELREVSKLTDFLLSAIKYYQDDISLDLYLEMIEKVVNPNLKKSEWQNLIKSLKDQIEISTTSTVHEAPEAVQAPIEGVGVNSALRYLARKHKLNAGAVSKPKYCDYFNIPEDSLFSLPLAAAGTMTDQEMIDCIFKLTDLYDIQFTSLDNDTTPFNALSSKVAQFTETDKINFFALFMDSLRGDKNLFRVYGPVNAYVDEDYRITGNLKEKNLNTVYGGARMLLDNRREIDPDDNTDIEFEWFTGHCRECNTSIPKKQYAVRLPVYPTGGWFGCFCKWECVMQYVEEQELLNEDAVQQGAKQLALIDKISKELHAIGLEDS